MKGGDSMSTATLKKPDLSRKVNDDCSWTPTKPDGSKTTPDHEDPDFKTATMSRWPPNVGKRCVKVKRTGRDVQVQDSKLAEDSPTLSFTHDEWRAFIDGVKKGEFDLPEDVDVESAELTLSSA